MQVHELNQTFFTYKSLQKIKNAVIFFKFDVIKKSKVRRISSRKDHTASAKIAVSRSCTEKKCISPLSRTNSQAFSESLNYKYKFSRYSNEVNQLN